METKTASQYGEHLGNLQVSRQASLVTRCHVRVIKGHQVKNVKLLISGPGGGNTFYARFTFSVTSTKRREMLSKRKTYENERPPNGSKHKQDANEHDVRIV